MVQKEINLGIIMASMATATAMAMGMAMAMATLMDMVTAMVTNLQKTLSAINFLDE